jgi:very-short-patch-repair endonuclease
MDAEAALTLLGGSATWGELLEVTTGHAVKTAVRRGRVVRLRRGRYGLHSVEEHRREAHRRTAVRSHLSAAAAHGWPVKQPPTQPWLTVARKRHLTAADRVGVHVTYRDLDRSEVADGITTPVRTVVDCALRLPFDEALVVADAALRCGDARPYELADAVTRLRGIGAPEARLVVAAADGRAANAFESVLRAICLQVPGLRVTPQVAIADDGIWAVVDLADVGLRLVVEAEGFALHGTRNGLVRDCHRYTELTVLGWHILRFTWEDVMHHPEWVRWALEAWVAQHHGRVGPRAAGATGTGRLTGR